VKAPLLIVAALAARGTDAAVADALQRAARSLTNAGASLQQQDPDALVVARNDYAETADLVRTVAVIARSESAVEISAGCAYGVRLNVDGRTGLTVSERSAAQALELARAAATGDVLVASQLGSLLSISTQRLPFELKPMRVLRTDGGSMAAYRAHFIGVDLAPAGVRPATPSGAPQRAATIAIPREPRRRARFAERLGARLLEDLGPVAPMLVSRASEQADTGQQLVHVLLAYLPPDRAERVSAIVDDELQRSAEG
jgi:hypothetical protein